MPMPRSPSGPVRRGDPFAQGLVGWWPLTDGGGSRGFDASGLGNHATLAAGQSFGLGAGGRALVFSGNQHATLPAPIALGATFSVGFRMRYSAAVAATGYHSVTVDFTNAFGVYLVGATAATFGVDVLTAAGEVKTTATFPTGIVYHVVVSVSAGVIGVFVNGIGPYALTTVSGSATTAGFTLNSFGSDTFNESFNGTIANVRAYNRAVGQAGAQALYVQPWRPGVTAPQRRGVALPAAASPVRFRRTLSSMGARAGKRQVIA